MGYELKRLTTPKELREAIALEKKVWGFSDSEADSSLLMRTLSLVPLELGYVLGAYVGETLVGLNILLATKAKNTLFGHLVCFDVDFRDLGLGARFVYDSFRLVYEEGMQYVTWLYEPLDSKNAHIYLNQLQGVATHYIADFLEEHKDGISIDRILCKTDLTRLFQTEPEPIFLEEALLQYPVVTMDNQSEADRVLFRIPPNYAWLLAVDRDKAKAVRKTSRKLLTAYLNEKNYQGIQILSGTKEGERSSYYLLAKIEL